MEHLKAHFVELPVSQHACDGGVTGITIRIEGPRAHALAAELPTSGFSDLLVSYLAAPELQGWTEVGAAEREEPEVISRPVDEHHPVPMGPTLHVADVTRLSQQLPSDVLGGPEARIRGAYTCGHQAYVAAGRNGALHFPLASSERFACLIAAQVPEIREFGICRDRTFANAFVKDSPPSRGWTTAQFGSLAEAEAFALGIGIGWPVPPLGWV